MLDELVLRGFDGLASSDGALKNWMLAAWAATTAKSNKMMVARTPSRRDTNQPPFNVVVVVGTVVVVVEEDCDEAVHVFATEQRWSA